MRKANLNCSRCSCGRGIVSAEKNEIFCWHRNQYKQTYDKGMGSGVELTESFVLLVLLHLSCVYSRHKIRLGRIRCHRIYQIFIWLLHADTVDYLCVMKKHFQNMAAAHGIAQSFASIEYFDVSCMLHTNPVVGIDIYTQSSNSYRTSKSINHSISISTYLS